MCFMEDNSVQNPYSSPNAKLQTTNTRPSYLVYAISFNILFVALCIHAIVNLDYDHFGNEFLSKLRFWIYLLVGMAVANMFFWLLFWVHKAVVRRIFDSAWCELILVLPVLSFGWATMLFFVEICAKYNMF